MKDLYLLQIEVVRITGEERREREQEALIAQREQEKSLMMKMLGFTRLFRVMKQCKKVREHHDNFILISW